jgi:predicted dithiol-disulfide oxidoreductase (DUF899 family)
MNTPAIASPQEWKAAHEQMRVKEKELTRARDALAGERRRMPWQAVETDYRFEGPDAQPARRAAPASAPPTSPARQPLR